MNFELLPTNVSKWTKGQIKAAYALLITKHLGVPLLVVHIMYILISEKAFSLPDAKSALVSKASSHYFTLGFLLIGYIHMLLESRRAKADEISNLTKCSDTELNLLLFAMRNSQQTISRYEDYSSITTSQGGGNLTNMTILAATTQGSPSIVMVKPWTFKYLSKNKAKIERLIASSKASTHMELKAGGATVTLSLQGENHSLIRFRDALLQLTSA